ncbi:MAG: hypothetical protein ABIC57_01115 [bacterium]
MSSEKVIQNPSKLIDELFGIRLENNKKLAEDYDKLSDYIKPFIEQDKEMLKLMRETGFKIRIGLNMDDVILCSSLLANNLAWEMARPKIPFKIKCHKCGEVVFDMTALEKEFEKKAKEE